MNYNYCLSNFNEIIPGANVELWNDLSLWNKISDLVDKTLNAWNVENKQWIDSRTMNVYINKIKNSLEVIIQDVFSPSFKFICQLEL